MGLALATIRNTVYNLGGVIRPGAVSEEAIFGDASFAHARGKMSTGNDFLPVSSPQFGLNFASFGAVGGRTYLIGDIGGNGIPVPFHYASIAAVILLRDSGKLRQAMHPVIGDYLLLPYEMGVNKDALAELQAIDLPFIDTKCKSDAFTDMRDSARAAAYNAGRELIAGLIKGWRENFGGEGQILAVAKTLADIPKEALKPDIVAVDDASSLLSSSDEGFVGNLPAGQMTHPFELADGRRYFYLRVRDHTLKDPGFGLLRVEFIPPDGITDADFAKAIAFYVLNERIPVNPDVTDSNQIYPLSACLNYLSDFTVAPQTVNSYFGRRD